MYNVLRSFLVKRKIKVIKNITFLLSPSLKINISGDSDHLFSLKTLIPQHGLQSSQVLWSGLMKPNLNFRGEINYLIKVETQTTIYFTPLPDTSIRTTKSAAISGRN